MRAHVGKIVDADPEALRHFSKHVAHSALVPAERPRPAGPLARQNDVHGASHAHGALELAAAPPDRAAMYGSDELGVDVASKKGLLHDMSIANHCTWGNVVLDEMCWFGWFEL